MAPMTFPVDYHGLNYGLALSTIVNWLDGMLLEKNYRRQSAAPPWGRSALIVQSCRKLAR